MEERGIGVPRKPSLNEIREIFAKMTNDFCKKKITNFDVFSTSFSQTFSTFVQYFRESFRLLFHIENDFRYLSKILFHFASRRMIVWGPHSWLTKLSRVWWEKNVFSWKYVPFCKYAGCPKLHMCKIRL